MQACQVMNFHTCYSHELFILAVGVCEDETWKHANLLPPVLIFISEVMVELIMQLVRINVIASTLSS